MTSTTAPQRDAPGGSGLDPAPRTAARIDPRGEILSDERPWGGFERFTCNESSTVKVITVAPGHRLSLQRHEERDELWIVLDDTLTVEVGERRWTAVRDERIWIPRRTTHRVGNPGTSSGRFLEVAFGTFDECDIERLEDDYTR